MAVPIVLNPEAEFGNRKAAKYVQYVIEKRIVSGDVKLNGMTFQATSNEVFLLFKAGFQSYIVTADRDLEIHQETRDAINAGIEMWNNGDELSEAVMAQETGLE